MPDKGDAMERREGEGSLSGGRMEGESVASDGRKAPLETGMSSAVAWSSGVVGGLGASEGRRERGLEEAWRDVDGV